MKRICVFCGSSPGARTEYVQAARQLGRVLDIKNIGLVYGGGSVGLMGERPAPIDEGTDTSLKTFPVFSIGPGSPTDCPST